MAKIHEQKKDHEYIDAGIDYLTCTYKPGVHTEQIYQSIARVERSEVKLGNIVHNWGMSGYIGQRVGGLEFGTSAQGCIVRLSGPTANRWWKRFGLLSSNCSRIDVQRTQLFGENPAERISALFELLHEHYSKRKRAPEPKMFVGVNGPETIYSGKRVSDTLLRIYHRGSRRGYEDCLGHLRFEAEFKNARSKLLLDAMLSSKKPRAIADGQLIAAFRNRGVDLGARAELPTLMKCPQKTGDVWSSLRWLDQSVRPTVHALIKAGYGPQVAQALQLAATLEITGSCPDKGEQD